MTSIAQFFDINEEPFVVTGRKIIESLKLHAATHYMLNFEKKTGVFACDSYHLYFDKRGFSDVYRDFLIKAFCDKKEFHPPVKTLYGWKIRISTSYKCNFRSVEDKKLKSSAWDKEETLKETDNLKKYLNEYLINYFYNYLSF